MKKLFITLFLMLISILGFSQIDYNIYIDKTKREITSLMKEDGFKYSVEQKLYVDIDSVGNNELNDTIYTYLISYDNVRALFTFDDKTDRCIKYYLLWQNLENYWLYFDYYNQILDKAYGDDLTWIEKRHKFYVKVTIKALNSKQFKIFVERKPYNK